MPSKLKTLLLQNTEAAPLAAFRILFGLLMFTSLVRFWAYGWIEKFYIEPKIHFSYYGFEWVKPIGFFTYLLFVICGISALLICFGYKYRVASVVFFLSFTYIELMEKATYLNHYYFISLLSFLLIFLPANCYYSLDAKQKPGLRYQLVPRWAIMSLQLMVGIVYFYAGLAKINIDWLWHAMPLKIWLASKYNFPFFGNVFQETWLAYAFSWAGLLYDLSIPFLLIWSKTRKLAFTLVVVFHALTWVLFPIGMFPFIMIISSLLFFKGNFHNQLLARLSKVLNIDKSIFDNEKSWPKSLNFAGQFTYAILAVFFLLQLVFPFRYLAYPGNLFWTEQGYRFSWRVMLMEKTGYAQFKVLNKKNGNSFYVDNTAFLSSFQEKQMSTQADFILQYAQFLNKEFNKNGKEDLAIYVDSYVSLNGRGSKVYIEPGLDLLTVKDSFKHKSWITDFEE